jgi:YbbR domain-containing protein
MERREKITVFMFSIIIALVMWTVVNLGRELNANVTFNLKVGELSGNRALISDLPETVSATVSGEGWRLLSLITNTQTITIDINESTIALLDVLREKMAGTGVTILTVQPTSITVDLEISTQKKVPILLEKEFTFRGQNEIVGSEILEPDSVIIYGAESVLKDIQFWPTKMVRLENLTTDINIPVELVNPSSKIRLSEQRTQLSARISEFTEGEQRVQIEATGLPEGLRVSFNPSFLSVRYAVALNDYATAQNLALFTAEVPYQDVVADTTGFVSPIITTVSDSIFVKVRLVQPRRVSYFVLIE